MGLSGLDGNEEADGDLLRCPVQAVEPVDRHLPLIEDRIRIKRLGRRIPDGNELPCGMESLGKLPAQQTTQRWIVAFHGISLE